MGSFPLPLALAILKHGAWWAIPSYMNIVTRIPWLFHPKRWSSMG